MTEVKGLYNKNREKLKIIEDRKTSYALGFIELMLWKMKPTLVPTGT